MDGLLLDARGQAQAGGGLAAALRLLAAPDPPPAAIAAAQQALLGTQFVDLVAALERDAAPPVQLYRAWIAANGASDPAAYAAWYNLGAALSREGASDHAIAAYRRALALRPDFAAAAVNLGLLQEARGETEAALATWSGALQPQDQRPLLLNQQARLLEKLRRLDAAEAALRASLAADPNQPDAWQHLVHLRQQMCRWPVLPADLTLPEAMVSLRWAGPLGTLALTDDIAAQAEAAADFVARKTVPAAPLAPPQGYRHGRIRIGYLSTDFCRHALSYLIAEVFERHDRTRFEVFGYCIGRDDGSALRARVLRAFDAHRLLHTATDEAAAAAIRADEIDILIDLNGLTSGARPQILRTRPAPVQASFLGFVGPVPVPELDHLFADDGVIPAALAPLYRPAPLAIAPLYQPNDRHLEVAAPERRADIGLPEDAFVFCCFAGNFKITPETFADWLAILRAVPGSVLWLPADNAWSVANLSAAAAGSGIDAARLVFAPRVEPARYLARLALADLFLDTFPYNAGTVASDALRMGLPLVTLRGRAFASRMAARLLGALGATDAIATDRAEYVARAIRFATDGAALAALRARCTPAAWAATIGDIEGFMRHYEATLSRIVRTPP